jgi:hypothetical protein
MLCSGKMHIYKTICTYIRRVPDHHKKLMYGTLGKMLLVEIESSRNQWAHGDNRQMKQAEN